MTAAEQLSVDPSRPLAGRTVLVTGGARRLGGAISLHLAERGARIVVHHGASSDSGKTAAAETARRCSELQGGTGAAIALGADLRHPDSAAALFLEAGEHGVEIDSVVHAAASFLRRPPMSTTAAEWDDVFALNLRAFYFLAVALEGSRGANGGSLVALSDSGARELWTGYLAHCVSKSALIDLVRILAKAMAPAFRVNAVLPGPVLPPAEATAVERRRMATRTLLGRIGRPEDIATAVEFLLTNSFTTGATLEVTGGAHLWRGSLGGPAGEERGREEEESDS